MWEALHTWQRIFEIGEAVEHRYPQSLQEAEGCPNGFILGKREALSQTQPKSPINLPVSLRLQCKDVSWT